MADQLDLIPAPAPERGRCPQCWREHGLIDGRLPPHPTPCPCQRRHLPGRRCPFETVCPGSREEPARDA